LDLSVLLVLEVLSVKLSIKTQFFPFDPSPEAGVLLLSIETGVFFSIF